MLWGPPLLPWQRHLGLGDPVTYLLVVFITGVRAVIVVAEDASQFEQIILLLDRCVVFTFLATSPPIFNNPYFK